MAWVNLISLWFAAWTLAMLIWHGERIHWRKRGTSDWGEEHGERFEYREVHTRNQVLWSIVLSFAVPARWHFRLRPENWYDRLSKRLRLAHEPQLGDAAFDARLYIDTDDAAMLQSWRDNPSLREHLKSLLKRIHAHAAELFGLDCEDGRLHVHLGVSRVQHVDRLRAETVAWLLPLLASLRDESAEARGASAGLPPSQPRKRGMELPRLVCFALFLGGALFFFWYLLLGVEPLLDTWPLFEHSFVCAAVAFPILLWWAMARTGARPERHRRFLEWVCMGTLGLIVTSFALVRAINQHLDFAEPENIAVTEMVLVERPGRKGGVRYSLHCRSQSGPLPGFLNIPISAGKYQNLKGAWGSTQRSSGVVRLHAGALGHPWVEPWY